MAVELQPDPSSRAVESSQTAALTGGPSAKAFAPKPPPQKRPEPTSQQSVSPPARETNVVFRRDSNGQIYYVFMDANTGREIQELPPKQVRAVGQGIAEIVKALEEKNSNRLKVKG